MYTEVYTLSSSCPTAPFITPISQPDSRSLFLLLIGLQTSCSRGFTVGSTATCTCSSDIQSSSLRWYRGGSPVNYGSSLTIAVSTDNEGEVYTCSMSSHCGSQRKSITVATTGMSKLFLRLTADLSLYLSFCLSVCLQFLIDGLTLTSSEQAFPVGMLWKTWTTPWCVR